MKLLSVAALGLARLAAIQAKQAQLVSCEVYCAYCDVESDADGNSLAWNTEHPTLNCDIVERCNCVDVDFCNAKLEQGNWMSKPFSNDDHTILLLDETSSLWYQWEGFNKNFDLTTNFICEKAPMMKDGNSFLRGFDQVEFCNPQSNAQQELKYYKLDRDAEQVRYTANIRHHIEEIWRAHFLDTADTGNNWYNSTNCPSCFTPVAESQPSDRRFTYAKFNTVMDIDHYKNKDAIPGSVLDECNYNPGGLTSMYDSLGCVLSNYKFERSVELFIMSDGQENSSKHFAKNGDYSKLQKLIKNAIGKDYDEASGQNLNWKIYFIGLAETKEEEFTIREKIYDDFGKINELKENVLIMMKHDDGLKIKDVRYNEQGKLRQYSEDKFEWKDLMRRKTDEEGRFKIMGDGKW